MLKGQDRAFERHSRGVMVRAIVYVVLSFALVFGYSPHATAADSITSGDWAPDEQIAVDFSQLDNAVASARDALAAYPVYDSDPSEVESGVHYVTSRTRLLLQSALDHAQGVARDADTTQEQIDAETDTVTTAHSVFSQSVLMGTKQPTSESVPTIDGIGIYLKDTDECLATEMGDYTQMYPSLAEMAHITSKGGCLELDYIAHWSNGDTSPRNDGNAVWWSSDTSVASFNSSRLEVHKDGTVNIRATANATKTGGAEIFAEATVRVDGQTDAVYIQDIRIIGPDGENITDGVCEIKEDLSRVQVQFLAEVDVFDSATGATATYTTTGRLSELVPALGDLTWTVGDPALGSIMENAGLFRPSRYGMVGVMVSSRAGFGGASVSKSTVVSTLNPSESDQGDEYHPQDSLTIKAYYELQPPSKLGEGAYVVDDTYSLDDLQSLGALTAAYTSFSTSGDYYTMRGCGVPLSTVLRESGIKLEGIKHFAFRTADWPDGENRPVTAAFVFADRYYYPNIDIGMFTEAQQVYPILAWASSQVRNSMDQSVPMTESARFRLLFGATPAGGNSQYQIKWINTIVVVLEGGPAVSNGDEADGDSGNNEGSGAEDADDNGGTERTDDSEHNNLDNNSGNNGNTVKNDTTSSTADTGSAVVLSTASDTAGGIDDAQGNNNQAYSAESEDVSKDDSVETTDASDATGTTGTTGSTGTTGTTGSTGTTGTTGTTGGHEFRVYQVMNKNASNTTELDIVNPFAPFAVPLGLLMVGAGGLESLLWFRFQRLSTIPDAHVAAIG